jgi:hypothetical protein
MTKSTPKIATERARDAHLKPTSKGKKASDAQANPTPLVAAEKVSKKCRKPKVAAEEASNTYRKKAPKADVEIAGDADRKIPPQSKDPGATQAADSMLDLVQRDVALQLEDSRAPQVPDSMVALAERSVAQTRELYLRTANALHAVLDAWERSLDAAAQGAVAVNRKILDIAERNINTGFDLATSLAGAKTVADATEVNATYWRKQFDELRMQAEEVRALSAKVTANVLEQIKSQVMSEDE